MRWGSLADLSHGRSVYVNQDGEFHQIAVQGDQLAVALGVPRGYFHYQALSNICRNSINRKQRNAGRLRYPALQVNLAGVVTNLLERNDALEVIIDAVRGGSDEVLGVVSINLDRVHDFGYGKHLQSGSTPSQYGPRAPQHRRWLNLLDGAPLAKRAGQLTGRQLPRLAGWDERFFRYWKKADFMPRLRENGAQIWFEPGALMRHRRGGSGAFDMLEALRAVNRVRYQEKWRCGIRALAFRGVVVLGSALRAWQPRHWTSIHYFLRRETWPTMPAAVGACPEGKP